MDFVPGTGGIVTAIHLGGASQPSRFYRVRLLTSSDVAPTADFTASPTFGPTPLKVAFVDTSTGYITSRFWNFGDGSTTNTAAAMVSHTYAAAGTNTVILTVSGPTGASLLTRTNYVVATAQLVVTSLRLSGSDVIVSFTSGTGQFYRLEYTDALSLSAWSTAIDSVTGTGNIVSVTHVDGASRSFRFYRVRLLP